MTPIITTTHSLHAPEGYISPHGRIVRKARVTLTRGPYSWFWIVRDCPYCHKHHDHYAGPIQGDPYTFLGCSYAARCDANDKQRLRLEDGTDRLWYILTPEVEMAHNTR